MKPADARKHEGASGVYVSHSISQSRISQSNKVWGFEGYIAGGSGAVGPGWRFIYLGGVGGDAFHMFSLSN